MSKGSSVDSDDEELFIDVEEDPRYPCWRRFTSLSSGVSAASDVTVLSLQAMVDAVVDSASVGSPSSSSLTSSRSVVVASSTTSSPRCSPSLCRRSSPGAENNVTVHARRCDSPPCDGARHRRRLPDVVQMPSVLHAERRHPRRSFLIEEILRPDFGRRRPTARSPSTPVDRRRKQFPPVEVGVNHVTSIWQPFAASPSRSVAAAVCEQRPSGRAGDVDRMKKSAKRKSRARTVAGEATNCAADESTTHQFVSVTRQSSSRPLSSSSSSSSSGTDVSAASSTTELSTNMTTTTQSCTVSPSKFGQLALPAWVFCTRYSDRPSSGIYYLYKSSVMT